MSNKNKLINSVFFYTKFTHKDNYNVLLDYANNILIDKQFLSDFIYNYYDKSILDKSMLNKSILNKSILYDIFQHNLSCNNFISLTKNNKQTNIGSSYYQCLQKDVFNSYQNYYDLLEYNHKFKHNYHLNLYSDFYIAFKFIYKSFTFNFDNSINNKNNIINHLTKHNKNNNINIYHKKILNVINKFNNRLFNLIFKMKNQKVKNKMIQFTSLSFNGINLLTNKQMMIEKSNKQKLTNAVINIKLPHINKITLFTKYNKKYHGDLKTFNYNINTMNQTQIPYNCQFIDDNKIKITLYRNVNKPNKIPINNDIETTVGVDVNTSRNLLALSTGDFFHYDEKLIKYFKQFDKFIRNKQKNKNELLKKDKNLSKQKDMKYSKRTIKRINKMNKRVISYCNYVGFTLVEYCKQHNIKHIVLEDLNIQSKSHNIKVNITNIFNYKINSNDLAKVLHLNDLKNVIKRIANKSNILVSFVNPSYTSQTCSICGNIDKNNRKQETFSCLNDNYVNNADTNASLNIKYRITNEKLRKKLEYYDIKENMYKGIKYRIKSIYESIYRNAYANINNYCI